MNALRNSVDNSARSKMIYTSIHTFRFEDLLVTDERFGNTRFFPASFSTSSFLTLLVFAFPNVFFRGLFLTFRGSVKLSLLSIFFG